MSTTTIRPRNPQVADIADNSLRLSPIFRRAVRDRAAHHWARQSAGEISALIREDLRRQWPGITEADIDFVLTGLLLAVERRATTSEEAHRNGLAMAQAAERAVWEDVTVQRRDGFGKPVRRASRPAREEVA